MRKQYDPTMTIRIPAAEKAKLVTAAKLAGISPGEITRRALRAGMLAAVADLAKQTPGAETDPSATDP